MLERLLDSLIQPFAGDVFITVQSKYQRSALIGIVDDGQLASV